jgi:hypothetical protein
VAGAADVRGGCTDFDAIEKVVLRQREIDAIWLTETLARLRAELVAWLASEMC